ncbi:Asd/ArgC dimerization domain-containing protein, partial [Planococcus sp. SIMBA_143]
FPAGYEDVVADMEEHSYSKPFEVGSGYAIVYLHKRLSAIDFTYEEMKMINETKKIMHDAELHVAATCVRLPIETGHAESVYVEIGKEDVSVEDVKELLKNAPGVTLK